jgi:hypothetical protein
LFGEDNVVRYRVSPEKLEHVAPWWTYLWWPRSQNFLRDALVHHLRPEVAGRDVVLDFSVRVRHAATPGDVENAAR